MTSFALNYSICAVFLQYPWSSAPSTSPIAHIYQLVFCPETSQGVRGKFWSALYILPVPTVFHNFHIRLFRLTFFVFSWFVKKRKVKVFCPQKARCKRKKSCVFLPSAEVFRSIRNTLSVWGENLGTNQNSCTKCTSLRVIMYSNKMFTPLAGFKTTRVFSYTFLFLNWKRDALINFLPPKKLPSLNEPHFLDLKKNNNIKTS